jgi:hypothetical protein
MEIINNLKDHFFDLNWLKIFEILIPAMVSIITFFVARYLEKQKEIEKEIREKKIKIYGDITKLIFEDIMGRAKRNNPLSDKAIATIYPKICNDLIFWGSDEVVKQYQKTFQSFRNPNLLEMMAELENLLLTIRKDTGHKNKGLEKYDLLKVFLNDLDETLLQQTEKEEINVANN